MTEIHEIHKTLCKGIDNKIYEDRNKVLDTICKVRTEKRKIATFDEALIKSGIKMAGMTKKIKDEWAKKWENDEPIYVLDVRTGFIDKKLDILGKESKIFEEIKCDINKIGEVKDTIEEMKGLNNIKELMECK